VSFNGATTANDIATWPRDSTNPWTEANVKTTPGCEKCPGQGGSWQIPTTSTGKKIIYENPSTPQPNFGVPASWIPGTGSAWSDQTTSVQLQGYLKVTVGGNYRFRVKNKEGAVLWVNDFGSSPAVDNDGTDPSRGLLNGGNWKESNEVTLDSDE